MRQQLRLTALSLLSLGLAMGCTEDPTYEVDMGDRSDDLGGRKFSIDTNDGTYIQAGLHTAQIALIERDDTSVNIIADSFVVNPNFLDFEVKQPAGPWISFNTTLYGFMFGYRTDSNAEWTPVTDDKSLSTFTIFESVKISLVDGGYQVVGTGISFDDIEFDNNSTNPANRFNKFDASATGLPRDFEMRITPIPVFDFGDFNDSYKVDFEVTVL